MSMKQMEQSLAMFRKTCLSQTGADPGKINCLKMNFFFVGTNFIYNLNKFEALVDGIHRGEFPEDKDLKVRKISFFFALEKTK